MTEQQFNKAKPGIRKLNETRNYQKMTMQKDIIVKQLRDAGCRVTRQRLLILDIILENDCSCCKEIYYQASSLDSMIGTATVYRFVNTLESIGAISRKNMYKVDCSKNPASENACTVILDDETTYHLTAQKWNAVIKAGLETCGYLKNRKLTSIVIRES